MQSYLPACKIVSTHGVRGEMKALPPTAQGSAASSACAPRAMSSCCAWLM